MYISSKFDIFEQLLTDIANDDIAQQILRESTLGDLRYVFESASLGELVVCLEIATGKEQYELCANLQKLIDEKKTLPDAGQ